MKLSLVFELLLIFVLLAFAASKSVKKKVSNKKNIRNRNDQDNIEDNSINKYCKCIEAYCNCCRDFAVPVLNLNGPGCATLTYLKGDKMAVSVSFGKKVIANRTLSSRKPSPVCLPLPGRVSKFCGRVYNIARTGEDFRACLGLELQSKNTVEAALRVSCFKFGPRGVISEPADPLPLVPQDEKVDEEDDDDDDDDDEDDFGLDDDDDDDDEEDDDDDDGELDTANVVDGADYAGFSILDEDLLGGIFGSSGSKKPSKNKKKQAPVSSTTTTKRPRPTRRPTRRPTTRSTTVRPVRSTTPRIRPITRRTTRRPTRRPSNSRPTRKPSTAESATPSSSAVLEELSTKGTPAMVPVTSSIEPSQEVQLHSEKHETIPSSVSVIPVQKPSSTVSLTTEKSVNELDDPSLAMSLAHITGQLSAMHVTPPLSSEVKVSDMPEQGEETVSFEKIETITHKSPSTVVFSSSAPSSESMNDDLIQIVQNLDSDSEETTEVEQDISVVDENRGHGFVIPSISYEGLKLPKKKHRGAEFTIEDLDVLDLRRIGEGIGQELGIFGGKRRQQKDHNKHHKNKVKNEVNEEDGIDDIVDTFDAMGDTLTMRKSDSGKVARKGRKRENKMMRGWSLV